MNNDSEEAIEIVPYEMPKLVPLPIMLAYYEPRYPLHNRQERRRFEAMLHTQAKRRIRTAINQLAKKTQEKAHDHRDGIETD